MLSRDKGSHGRLRARVVHPVAATVGSAAVLRCQETQLVALHAVQRPALGAGKVPRLLKNRREQSAEVSLGGQGDADAVQSGEMFIEVDEVARLGLLSA